jgi:hypothetical protein
MLKSLPDLFYNISASPVDPKWIYTKNLWKRAEILPEYKNALSLFDEYIVKNGETPENIAFEVYDNPFYAWTILIANNITNFHDQWPKSAIQLNEYVNEKYENPTAIKHYVTTELRDANGRLIVAAGKVVPSTFSVSYYDGQSTITATPVQSVTNYTYESELNSEKEKIQLFRPDIIRDVVNVYEKILKKNGEFQLELNSYDVKL